MIEQSRKLENTTPSGLSDENLAALTCLEREVTPPFPTDISAYKSISVLKLHVM